MVTGSCSGFSWKPTTRQSSSTWTMPNWIASDFLIGRQAIGRDRPLLEVEVGHLPDVHLVDVVGAEHQHGVARGTPR